MRDYEVVADALYKVILWGLEYYSADFKNAYISNLIKGLNAHKFVRRRKSDPVHPHGVRHKGNKLQPLKVDMTCGSDAAKVLLRVMRPYFNADTGRNTRDALVRRLKETSS